MFAKRLAFIAAAIVATAGCDDETTSTSGGGGSSDGGGGSSATTTVGTGGMGGSGGAGGGEIYIPTADDIDFTPAAAIPTGEQILFNDWSFPDRLLSMEPDGSNAIEIFSVYRIWSMGVSRAGDRLAFSAGDSEQEAHYGITIGDAIQHTFVYDFATESVEVAAYGNINDECHHYGPNDTAIYLCRRYDFTPEGTYGGYRLGVITAADQSFEFLVPEEPMVFTLSPQVTADGSEMYFGRIQIMGAQQQRSIGKIALPDGTPELVRGNAYRPLLSPDGTRYLYADSSQGSALYASDLDGQNQVLVSDLAGTNAAYSPDGTQVAFLVHDNAANCSMIHVAATDGSQSADPPIIRDCATTGEFITELAWFVR